MSNRHNKPVGWITKQFVDYAAFPQVTPPQPTPRMLQAFTHRPGALGHGYADFCAPWTSRNDAVAYLARLHALKTALGS